MKSDNNSKETLGKVLEKQVPALWPMCYRACAGKHADAEDVLQEICYRAFKSLHTYDASRPLVAWLRGIGRRVIADHFRSQKTKAKQMELVKENIAVYRPVSKSVEDSVDRNQALKAVLEKLDPLTRTVLVFRYMEDLSWSEIAKELDITKEVVKKRLQRGKAQLRVLLANEEGERS